MNKLKDGIMRKDTKAAKLTEHEIKETKRYPRSDT